MSSSRGGRVNPKTPFRTPLGSTHVFYFTMPLTKDLYRRLKWITMSILFETEGFGFILKLTRSFFLDRVVFLRVGPFYSHISDSCHKSHDLL